MNKRYEILDIFRGIAALMVVFHHLFVKGNISNLNLIKNSYLFVEFFFVLSGFVIALSYSKKINNFSDLSTFIKKRFARLWPLHIFMLFLFIPFAIVNQFMGINFGDRFSLFAFVNNIFLMQALGLNADSTWNIPAWSISVEFYTYIIFSLLILFCPKKWPIISIVIILFSLLTLYTFSSLSDVSQFAIFRCLYSFFIGVIAFYIHQKVKFKSYFEVLIILFLIIFLSQNIIAPDSWQAYISPIIFFFVILIFSNESGIISRSLNNSFLQLLGTLSFSIYLTHTWIIICIKSISIILEKFWGIGFMYTYENMRIIDFGLGYANDLFYIPYLALVILMSWFTYNYIEIPGKNYLLNLPSNKKNHI